jgi:D-amino-acid dehydrogenase
VAQAIVIGAGIIGIACAYELCRRGAGVTVVDGGDPPAPCSAGNLGWVVPSFSEPLPAPGLAVTSLRWMTRRDSPLYVRPQALPRLAPWLWTFWRHCNPSAYHRGLETLTRLNRPTMAAYDAWAAAGIAFEMHRSGVLFVFETAPGMRRTLEDLDAMEAHGDTRPDAITRRDLRDVEPALSVPAAGGVLVRGERHVRPESLLAGLSHQVLAMGGVIRRGVPVTGLDRRGHEVSAVVTHDGERLRADVVVIAAGAWTGILARSAGARLPVEAGKGYTVTVVEPALRLQRPVYFGEARLGLSPFDGALRVGGTMELSGLNVRLDRRRVETIRSAASRVLPGWERGRSVSTWVGARPLTPDGLPIVGRVPGLGNLFVATGHGMLGMTLAPATAVMVADLITGGAAEADLPELAPGRFG